MLERPVYKRFPQTLTKYIFGLALKRAKSSSTATRVSILYHFFEQNRRNKKIFKVRKIPLKSAKIFFKTNESFNYLPSSGILVKFFPTGQPFWEKVPYEDENWIYKCIPFLVIDCGSLSSMEHGTVVLKDNRTSHGARAIYSCHENYTLIGKRFTSCPTSKLSSPAKCLQAMKSASVATTANGPTPRLNAYSIGVRILRIFMAEWCILPGIEPGIEPRTPANPDTLFTEKE